MWCSFVCFCFNSDKKHRGYSSGKRMFKLNTAAKRKPRRHNTDVSLWNSLNLLSSNINLQILQTDLQTFPLGFLIRAGNSPPTFLWKSLPKNPTLILMMSVFCSIALIFAPECWKRNSERPRFQNFFQGACPWTPLVTCTFGACKLHLWRAFFPFPATPKLLPPT